MRREQRLSPRKNKGSFEIGPCAPWAGPGIQSVRIRSQRAIIVTRRLTRWLNDQERTAIKRREEESAAADSAAIPIKECLIETTLCPSSENVRRYGTRSPGSACDVRIFRK